MFGLVLMLEVNLSMSCLTWLAAQEVIPSSFLMSGKAKWAWSWLQETCVTADVRIRVGWRSEAALGGVVFIYAVLDLGSKS